MNTPYSELVILFKKLAKIEHAITFLQWDQLVMMPPKGNETRSQSIAELTALHHELLTSPTTYELVEKAKTTPENPTELRSIEEMEYEYIQNSCLSSEFVKAKSLAGIKCEHGWRTQRKNNDWDGFLQNFKPVVELLREEAEIRQDSQQADTPYDALLELYCRGDSSEKIESVFNKLRETLPDLINQIVEKQSALPKSKPIIYPVPKQEKLSYKLMEILGFDFAAGRLDVSAHPFSTGDKGDQRITTRFDSREFLEPLMATAHETGHASYEANLPEPWRDLPIGSSSNMCIHESQSLLYEKQIFLSAPFLTFFTKYIHELLPESIHLSPEQIHRKCLRVEPSYIRVEADEATYPLHVILRFEIEKDLINRKIQTEDIPELWNEKMKNYLGISTAGNYKDGCMQDIHWTDGAFGYFPSYTMGALNAAQLFTTIKKEHPDWRHLFQKGDITFIQEWLRNNIWSKGSSMDSQEIIKKATGEETNPDFFLEHLRNRYL